MRHVSVWRVVELYMVIGFAVGLVIGVGSSIRRELRAWRRRRDQAPADAAGVYRLDDRRRQ